MNITLKPAKPEPVLTEKIILNGVEIGAITREDENSYYRVKIDGGHGEGLAILYQGHGDTPEEAIRALIGKHRNNAQAQLRRMDELEEGIFGEVTP